MENRPVVFTISQINNADCRLYTRDARVKDADREVTIHVSNLINTMIMISEILNDEGYAVLFEVD